MIRMRVTSLFFDRAAIMGAVSKATVKIFKRFGGFVRIVAKRSIRKRKSISRPGQPPHSHTGLLKKFIFFSYDPGRRSVVIGPTPLPWRIGPVKAPPLLEYGGTTFGLNFEDKLVRMSYRARPYMGPAFEKGQAKLPAMWADSVKP